MTSGITNVGFPSIHTFALCLPGFPSPFLRLLRLAHLHISHLRAAAATAGRNHGCQMAVAIFLESHVFCPSGFSTMALLRYAAKFYPFLSLDCPPPRPPPWRNPRKGRDQILPSGNLGRNHLNNRAREHAWEAAVTSCRWKCDGRRVLTNDRHLRRAQRKVPREEDHYRSSHSQR